MVVDILIRVLRSVLLHQLPSEGSQSAEFLDTKFGAAIMKNFPKFLKSKNKESYIFPKSLSGIFPTKEAPKCYDVARPKSVAQFKNEADSDLISLLFMASHALYGPEACKNIGDDVLVEESKSATILAYEFKEKL
ncbi:hypothetical protein F2Q70_00031051 [Brassica cretica]|uniref:Uncharacterized protein n=1 Tax=Brassica cretica TaxID=69181 RepID=A0A8S9FE46_BRACR|nr:hypothetical protein F2Q70_00031051 [Brassica cretica]